MPQQVVMRRRIIEVLAYPRQVAKANIDLSSCPHSGFFKAMDSRCEQCSKSYECDWLNSTDAFNDLGAKPMEFLYRALTFGIDYVDGQTAHQYHDGETCECDSCNWIRNARGLIDDYSEVPIQI